jgi:hypothetical protein
MNGGNGGDGGNGGNGGNGNGRFDPDDDDRERWSKEKEKEEWIRHLKQIQSVAHKETPTPPAPWTPRPSEHPGSENRPFVQPRQDCCSPGVDLIKLFLDAEVPGNKLECLSLLLCLWVTSRASYPKR